MRACSIRIFDKNHFPWKGQILPAEITLQKFSTKEYFLRLMNAALRLDQDQDVEGLKSFPAPETPIDTMVGITMVGCGYSTTEAAKAKFQCKCKSSFKCG